VLKDFDIKKASSKAIKTLFIRLKANTAFCYFIKKNIGLAEILTYSIICY
jgi:hypothetical protein